MKTLLLIACVLMALMVCPARGEDQDEAREEGARQQLFRDIDHQSKVDEQRQAEADERQAEAAVFEQRRRNAIATGVVDPPLPPKSFEWQLAHQAQQTQQEQQEQQLQELAAITQRARNAQAFQAQLARAEYNARIAAEAANTPEKRASDAKQRDADAQMLAAYRTEEEAKAQARAVAWAAMSDAEKEIAKKAEKEAEKESLRISRKAQADFDKANGYH